MVQADESTKGKNGADETPARTAISVSGLSKTFGRYAALSDVSFDVREGEIFGILGPDGAGKTTMMRILSGLMPFLSGSVTVMGRDLSKGPGDLCDHIAYMPQRFGLYEDLTVLENIYFYADLYDMARGPELEKRIEDLLGFCRMLPFKDRLAGKLSGGMKQKLGLTCALIHTPKMLFLDEPTNGVDPVSRREFWKILHDMLKSGITIFVSTTYLDEAERCNRIAFLNRGRIMAIDSPAKLKRSSKKKMWLAEVSDKFRAIGTVAKLPGVDSALVMGASLHVFTGVDTTREAISATMEKALAPLGVTLGDVRESLPSLEDIFVELVR